MADDRPDQTAELMARLITVEQTARLGEAGMAEYKRIIDRQAEEIARLRAALEHIGNPDNWPMYAAEFARKALESK
jgi:hypothetical protein